MQYAFVFYEAPAAFALRGSEQGAEYFVAWEAYMQSMYAAGIVTGGEALQPPATAKSIRLGGEAPQVQDGPYIDTKEQIGGYVTVELPTMEAAQAWAARCPCAKGGGVEIRPLWEM